MLKLLDQINKKSLISVLAGTLLVTLATTSVYAIWPQVKELRSGQLTRMELRGIVDNKDALLEQITQLQKEIDEKKHRLKGDMANLPEKKMEAYIIGELQNISWDHEIDLISVKPAKGNEIQMFQEILFKVQLSGDYFDLYKWLLDLKKQLGFIVIKSLELNNLNKNDPDTRLLMNLIIASYKSI